jgi:type IV secretory pathway TraG/TraD family ATPase VirD4
MEAVIGLAVLAALAAWALKRAFDKTGLSPLLGIFGGALWRFFQPLSFLRPNEGAKFLGGLDGWRLVNPSNGGLVVDGDRGRLTEDDSFRHLVLVAPPGAGKTTRYVVPNVLQLDGCSMLVTDPSGSVWKRTSGDLRRRGFDVKVLNLADPSRSVGYNPMAKVRTALQASDLAKTLVASSAGSSGKDAAFWNQGAEYLIDAIVETLAAPDYAAAHPEHVNLHNVLHLAMAYGRPDRAVDAFIERRGTAAAIRMWAAATAGKTSVVQIYQSTATNVLGMLAQPEIASLLSRDELDFREMRRRKTALFVVVPEDRIESYAFVLNLLYAQSFGAWMEGDPDSRDLPVYVLADEFGHSSIPRFSAIINNIRKYRVSVSMVLQAVSQLDLRYGKDAGETILGGANARMVMGGADLRTTTWFEKMAGRTRYRTYDEMGPRKAVEENLINADRIRTLADDQALLLFANKEPALLRTTPYFRNGRLDWLTKAAPWNPAAGRGPAALSYVDLKEYAQR